MVIGLRNATPSEISQLKKDYPTGVHVTHKLDGTKLPFNGCFYCKVTDRLKAWAVIK